MKILIFPGLRQTFDYDCGASALQAVLVYYGIELSEDSIIKLVKTDKKNGTSVLAILKALKKYKLKYKAGRMKIKDVKNCIDRNIPVILLLQAWRGKKNFNYKNDFHDGHYVVAIGHDDNKIFFEDPYSFERVFLEEKELKERWHARGGKKKITNLGIAVYGKPPAFDPKKIVHME